MNMHLLIWNGHELSENSDVSDSESDDNQDNDVQVNE